MKPSGRIPAPVTIGLLVFLCLTWSGNLPVAEGQQAIEVNSADPPAAPQGTINLNVTIRGKGFKKGAQASFFVTGTELPDGVRVNSTTFISPGELRANIDVTDSATVASYDIQVANSDGRTGKGIELFAVTSKGPKSEPPPDPAIAYSEGWLKVMNADGTNQTVVWNRGTSRAPDWSPDARRLVFLYAPQNAKQQGIYLINLDGSGLCKLAPHTDTGVREYSHPVWSPVPMPDGSEWIIYADYSSETKSRDLFAVRADCASPGKPVNLTQTTVSETGPSWSRLANRLAAWLWDTSETLVYDVSLVNGVPKLSNPIRLKSLGLFTSMAESIMADWAPNEDRLVLAVLPARVPGIGYDLWVTDLTYSGTYALTDTADAYETRASWSPDGTEIVYYDMANNGWLWKLARRVNPDGTESWVRTQQLVGPIAISYRGHSWRRCDPCR